MSRVVSWFSCGAASAVATKIMLSKNQTVDIVYCHVVEEHWDNIRFLQDCEKWFNQKVTILRNEHYNGSCFNVFETNYFRTPSGSPCTRALKQQVRLKYQHDDDTIVFGYTLEEENRLNRFIDNNNGINVVAPLIDAGLSKSDVLAMIERAGIELPQMYKLGYEHNNCVGCVKGGMGYWNKIRVDFPDRFKQYADMEKRKGYTILKEQKINKKTGKREAVPLYLHDLEPDRGRMSDEPEIQCGILCENTEKMYSS